MIMILRLPNTSLRYPANADEQALAIDQQPTTQGCNSLAPSSRVISVETDAVESKARPIGAPNEIERA